MAPAKSRQVGPAASWTPPDRLINTIPAYIRITYLLIYIYIYIIGFRAPCLLHGVGLG